MDVELQRRIACNEDLFRKVNEGIRRGLWPGEADKPVRFRCECPRLDCSGVVELTVRDYERIRQHPRQFVVVEGHEVPEVESVVENGSDYAVVRKRAAAGKLAEAADPRG